MFLLIIVTMTTKSLRKNQPETFIQVQKILMLKTYYILRNKNVGNSNLSKTIMLYYIIIIPIGTSQFGFMLIFTTLDCYGLSVNSSVCIMLNTLIGILYSL